MIAHVYHYDFAILQKEQVQAAAEIKIYFIHTFQILSSLKMIIGSLRLIAIPHGMGALVEGGQPVSRCSSTLLIGAPADWPQQWAAKIH